MGKYNNDVYLEVSFENNDKYVKTLVEIFAAYHKCNILDESGKKYAINIDKYLENFDTCLVSNEFASILYAIGHSGKWNVSVIQNVANFNLSLVQDDCECNAANKYVYRICTYSNDILNVGKVEFIEQ